MTTEIVKAIGTRLSALRILRKIDRQSMATTIGISMNKLGRIEAGKTEPSATELIRFAEALGVPTTVITGEEKYSEFMDRVLAAGGAN